MSRNNTHNRWWPALWLGAAVFGLSLVGCGGGGEEATTPQTSGSGGNGGTPAPSMGGGIGDGGPSLPAGGGLGGGGFGAGGGAGGQQASAGGGAPADTTTPPGSRPDPFKIPWTIPDPPIGDSVPPVRVANFDTQDKAPDQINEIQEAPSSRAAGIMISNGVWAIIEGPLGPPQIVRPGDTIGDYHVESINSSSVVLKRREGNNIITQIVPLTDAGSAPPAPRTGVGRGPGGIGGPGFPGMGGPGFPGGAGGLGAPGRGKAGDL